MEKIKELLGWNQEEYSVQDVANGFTPTRPPRRKRASRNSVVPSESSEIKVSNSPARLQVSDIETNEDEAKNYKVNHIWREQAITLQWNAHNYPEPYYNIPYAIPYLD